MYLTHILHRAVQQTPDDVATICGDRVRTWQESAERVARLAGGLRALGACEGDRIGILALNSDRYHEVLLAAWWAGCAVNPVNIRWSAKEIAYSLADSSTRVLFVDDAFAPLTPALHAEWDGVTTLIHCGDGPTPQNMHSHEELILSHEPLEETHSADGEPAGVFYTGGTTGFPKGVVLSHANIWASVLSAAATVRLVRQGGRMMVAAPMFHLAGLSCWYAQSLIGGSHVFVPAFEPAAVLQVIEKHRPTATLLVPAMVQMLVDHPDAGSRDLSSLETLVYGAAPISRALLERTHQVLPRTSLVQGYGMTEMAPCIAMLGADDHNDGRLLRSAGRALAGVEVRIVDREGAEVPQGTVGEIVARGEGMMQGYWKKPHETAEALRGGWMHTGDAGYLDADGYLFLVDRVKDMIVTGAENVYSTEVENAVAQHPSVAACAVIGVPDAQWGERVHAVVVLRPGCTATAEEIRDHTKSLIAGYKAPRSCEFVDELPLSAAGKVLKRELRAPHWQGTARRIN
ncbi:long-chain-fatty-acid--CoA ligase [Streptomyces pristinaespiralis]|uniref:Feruloyl-CoA synthetase n=2 Tax=Streptomyces pristinaespiralis TaxID=38300 RepID=B5H6S7_STRE2|nr:long-chain-fatty-acid--CoA ligase [Streptomyces pristinaespiralis]ALC18706.1 fatty-acid--CoA ligase [Streptomyces pristinaespiralis]EDY62538.1 feruloyl-CoA synthetase [Streptomyces pristinaespiralis ATCC 25486]QMU18131.1 long-chain-fatty-acid--CoA ligase [Streptomyces pristinaespiralis]